jgi:hypothetical protein
VNQLKSCGGGGEALPAASVLPAVLCVVGSVTVPAAASVYNEYALKRHMDTSVHLQNFFLYFYGMLFNLVGAAVTCLIKGEGVLELFDNQSLVTAALVVNNAAQVGWDGGAPGSSCSPCSQCSPCMGPCMLQSMQPVRP